MWDAYRRQVLLAVGALAVGALLAAVDRWGPAGLRARVPGAVAATAAVGAWRYGSVAALPAWGAAAVALVPPDRERPLHPLGRWALPAAVASLAGVWAAVPDVEPALLGGAVLAPVAAARAASGRSVGSVGTAVVVFGVVAAAVAGSAGWPVVFAAAATVGMVAVLPLAATALGATHPAVPPPGATPGPGGPAAAGGAVLAGRRLLVAVVVHLVVAVPAGRLAVGRGVAWSVSDAVLTLAVCAAVAIAVLSEGARPRRRAAR